MIEEQRGSEGGAANGKPEAVRIRLLGGFRISVGVRTIEESAWRLRKASTLVKLLALATGHRLHREQVMDLLWPDAGSKAASNNLRQVLHAARKTLAPDPIAGSRYLRSEDESLVLCPEGQLWVDAEAFEEAAATARRARDPAAYRAALELYAGELLPGDLYEEWAEGRRGELRRTYLALLAELAMLYEERGEYGPAVAALRRAVAEEPTLEEAHAGLMRLYALSGRQGEALSQYERLREALSSKLGAEPGANTRRLREEIATGRFPPAQPPPVGSPAEEPADTGKHNLPAQRTSFVGRERELVEVKRALAMTRLLTLTGAGGSGKTRLALEVARDLVGAYPDGVWLVELAPLTEGVLVVQATAAAVGVQEQPEHSLTDTLTDFLRKKNMLLVVDNCEHLMNAAALLVDILLNSCPHLRVLATSREALGIAGEMNWPVPSLSLPDPRHQPMPEELKRYESVRLFLERARYRNPAFELTPQNARAVVEICERLEGIPLAIELAAARVGLSVEQIAARLDDSLRLLTTGSRTSTPRQRTLRGTLDWSYELLSEPEQKLLGRLSVFAGGWALEAAEVVGAGNEIGEEEVLDLLLRLVDKSLVVAGASTGGAVRYRMLEPIRQYARQKLEESGEADEVKSGHAALFLAMAEEAEPELSGPQQRMWIERLEEEHDNLRAALSWLLESGEGDLGLQISGALWRFWLARGYLSEGLGWLEQALAGNAPAPAARVKALEGIGWLAQQGDSERAKAAYKEMLKLSRELDDKENIATALNGLATLAVAQGEHERATALLEANLEVLQQLEKEGSAATPRKRFHVISLMAILATFQERDHIRAAGLWEESVEVAREVDDAYLVGAALSNLGYAVVLQGDYERALEVSEEALTLIRELGKAGVDLIPEGLVNLGLAARSRSDHERAAASFKEALALGQRIGHKLSVVNALEAMAGLAGALGENARAARLWGAAQASREVTGVVPPPDEYALHEPYLVDACTGLGTEVWEEVLAEGRTMSLEEAVEYALSEDAPVEPPPPMPEQEAPAAAQSPSLTRREKEVATLVARGLTNRRIAEELVVSKYTVDNHVRNILKKLRLDSRDQIAAQLNEPHQSTGQSLAK